MAKSNENLSLAKEVVLHGVTIRKMPNGKYLQALAMIKELPETFVKEVLDGKTDIQLSSLMNVENLVDLVGKLLCVLPEFTLNFLSVLLDVDINKLQNELTPLETIEIVEKFIEINNLASFFTKMKSIYKKAQSLLQIGFNETSQVASK